MSISDERRQEAYGDVRLESIRRPAKRRARQVILLFALSLLTLMLVGGWLYLYAVPLALAPVVTRREIVGAAHRLAKIVGANSKQFGPVPARLSVRALTDLAACLAGSGRPKLAHEWRTHLGGDSGHDRITWRKNWQALGFVVAAVRLRLSDAKDIAWRPVDAALGSRALSNLFVWGPVITVLVAIVHHDGRFGLVADDQDPVALGAFLYVVIKTGRWWRGVRPPEPKAKRAKE